MFYVEHIDLCLGHIDRHNLGLNYIILESSFTTTYLFKMFPRGTF